MDIENRGVIEPAVFLSRDSWAADARKAWPTAQVAAIGELSAVLRDQILDGVQTVHEGLAIIQASIESPRMQPPFQLARGSSTELWRVLKHLDGQRVMPRQEFSD